MVAMLSSTTASFLSETFNTLLFFVYMHPYEPSAIFFPRLRRVEFIDISTVNKIRRDTMNVFSTALFITLGIILFIVVAEVCMPKMVEGFSSSVPYWGSFVSPRSDIGPTMEDSQYKRDIRYYHDYQDVSRMGVPYDFCRMLASKEDETNLFFACALAGTDTLSPVSFRTASVKDGFRISRDDYMRDINKDGRSDYCRILQYKDNTYQPLCQRAGDLGFEAKDVIDPSPRAIFLHS